MRSPVAELLGLARCHDVVTSLRAGLCESAGEAPSAMQNDSTPSRFPSPASTLLELIGNTPIVRIQRMCPNPRVLLLAKLEGFNPTGSIKDRIALKMIEQAEHEGSLTRDKVIVEPTSGNTGIAFAMIGAIKGYQSKSS